VIEGDVGRSILCVHAHPDDETITSGMTMARYAADPGCAVTLVTCTLGEQGDIVRPELARLGADRGDRLGEHRLTELRAALDALGVTDSRLLGGPGRYRDSGMMGTPPNDRVDCFWRADLLEAASQLVAVIREVRPQVLVTYDDAGGYGHPDHIQAHRVTMYAFLLAGVASFRPDLGDAHLVSKVYWTVFPRCVSDIEALRALAQAYRTTGADPVGGVPFPVEKAWVTTAIDGGPLYPAKLAALRAHASGIAPGGAFFAVSDQDQSGALVTEYFRLVLGSAAGPFDADGRETDLFAGV
jgi:N-acetyl-1-D-myo-inositol-2-amino-2-deoxy-alpha-D-glucopyranoside deacetylase